MSLLPCNTTLPADVSVPYGSHGRSIRTLHLPGQLPFSYEIITSARARAMRLTVYPGGILVATLPSSQTLSALESFIHAKALWILKALRRMRVAAPNPRTLSGSAAEYLARKEQARAFVLRRIAILNAHYCFRCAAVHIRNQRMRWGSCSRKGNLSFHYRILFLPPHLADYLIVHELCHLKEFNHSPRFWNLVAQIFPEYKKLRTALREYNAISNT